MSKMLHNLNSNSLISDIVNSEGSDSLFIESATLVALESAVNACQDHNRYEDVLYSPVNCDWACSGACSGNCEGGCFGSCVSELAG